MHPLVAGPLQVHDERSSLPNLYQHTPVMISNARRPEKLGSDCMNKVSKANKAGVLKLLVADADGCTCATRSGSSDISSGTCKFRGQVMQKCNGINADAVNCLARVCITLGKAWVHCQLSNICSMAVGNQDSYVSLAIPMSILQLKKQTFS